MLQRYSKGFWLFVLQMGVYLFAIIPPFFITVTDFWHVYALDAWYGAVIVGGLGMIYSFLQKDRAFFIAHLLAVTPPLAMVIWYAFNWPY